MKITDQGLAPVKLYGYFEEIKRKMNKEVFMSIFLQKVNKMKEYLRFINYNVLS